MSTGPVDPRLLRLARPALPGVLGQVALGVLGALADAAALVAAGLLVAALVGGTSPRTTLAALAAALVVRALVAAAAPRVAAGTADRVVEPLRERLLDARDPDAERRDPGARVRRALAGGGIDDLRAWFTGYLPALVLAVVLPPLVLLGLAVADPASALIVLATLPLLPLFAALVGWATRARAARQWAAGERLAGHVLDVVTGLATLRLFGRGRRQVEEVARVGEAHRRATGSVLRVAFLSTTALDLVATVSVGIVAVSAGLRVVDGSLALAPALVAILLAPEAYRPIREVGARFHDTARVSAIMDDLHVNDAGRQDDDIRSRGARASSVRVRYPGRRGDALRLDHLEVAPGELVALAGESGAGKTTLLRVLAGAVRADAGTVAVADPLLVLPQRPTLPHARTVADALGDGVPHARMRAVLAALDLPLHPDDPLAEAGGSVSAGQRERLALARVLLALSDTPYATVLLDEPTAHLDPSTEARVLGLLRAAADRGAAVLLVAHRAAALAAADRVITVVRPPAPDIGERHPAPRVSGSAAVPAGPRRGTTVAGVALGAGAVLAGLLLTAVSTWLIVRADARPPVLTLSIAVVLVRASAILRPLLRHLERLVVHDGALARVAGWRRALVAVLVDRVPGAVAGRRGELLAHAVDDVDTRLDGLVRGRQPLLVAALVVPVVLAVAAVAVPTTLPALAVGLGVAVLLVPVVAARTARRNGAALDTAGGRLRAAVVETLAAREELAAADRDAALAVVRDRSSALAAARRRAARHDGLADGAAHLGLAVATLGAALAATGLVGASPELVGIIVLLPTALAPTVLALPAAARALVRGRLARQRLAGLAGAPVPAAEPLRPRPLPVGHDLRIAGLTAGWAGAAALHGVDLDLPAGARVAVTGVSGSGKSTLAAVLLRLLDPSSGTVTLGGVPLGELAGDDVRRRIGLLGDHDHVFTASLRANLLLAAPDADDDRLLDALRRVRLAGWVAGLEDGLDTVIGVDTVSGGERRRLAAARLLLADPAVRVLDEPTEGLDADTAEALVADLLDTPATVLLLTHRPEGLDRVDRVLHLDAGRLTTPARREPSVALAG